MKKALGVVLVMALFWCCPTVVHANSLSYIIPSEVDGIPTEIKEIAEVIGSELNICPELLEAIAERESRFQSTATNGPCKGLMQINTSVHQDRFEEMGWSATDWQDSYKNMYVSASLLSDLFQEYEDVSTVLALYHGEKNAIEKSRAGKMSSYTKGILERSEELERVHGK